MHRIDNNGLNLDVTNVDSVENPEGNILSLDGQKEDYDRRNKEEL